MQICIGNLATLFGRIIINSARLPRSLSVSRKKKKKVREFSDYSGLQDGAACDPHQNNPMRYPESTLQKVRESYIYTLARSRFFSCFFSLRLGMRCVEMFCFLQSKRKKKRKNLFLFCDKNTEISSSRDSRDPAYLKKPPTPTPPFFWGKRKKKKKKGSETKRERRFMSLQLIITIVCWPTFPGSSQDYPSSRSSRIFLFFFFGRNK